MWYMGDGQEHSAKLQGSLTGDERLAYWEDLKQFRPETKGGKEEEEEEGGEGEGDDAV